MADTCTQPGCTGTIEDGYCNVCGLPADQPADQPAGGAPAGPAGAGSHPTTPAHAPAMSTRTTPSSSNRLASAPIGSARAAKGSRSTRKQGTSSSRLRGARLGAGITTVPSTPATDPLAAVLVDPKVPEDRRFCPKGHPVGRTRGGQPGRTDGFCPTCRNPFSFSPKLRSGDLLAGQYEVVGCLAHGGLGWIYLARDRNVSDRWVVLKGLLNSDDPDAVAAAIAERQFLAEVEHPLIVEIYNFVMHDGAGYIVMEYVGGYSLKSILKDRMAANGGQYDPIPVDQAIAYLVEVLPAFQYLHDTGLLYCDFKPDNIIQSGDAVKLIDLGGVRRVDDYDSAIYGTIGFQAPEVPEVGPSIPSDIFTIGRSLCVLAMEFRGYQSTYAASLPTPVDVPLFAEHDSLYRLLLKACAPDPADRFQSADELRVQLLGVLREVVARHADLRRPAPHPAASALFDTPAVAGDTLSWEQLPALRVDPGDPMFSWLANVSVVEPTARADALTAAPEASVEVRLAEARASIEAGLAERADTVIGTILGEDPWEWRAVWLAGQRALASDDVRAAQAAFNAVYGQVPGELAPKLALALACERGGEPDVAEVLYLTCARTDASYTAPAAFGLARIREARGDLAGAVAALDLVTPVSRSFVEARQRRAGLLVRSDGGLQALAQAIDSVAGITIDPRDRVRLRVDVLDSALRTVTERGPAPDVRIGGIAAEEGALRDGLEAAYRELAGLTDDHVERVALVDRANESRRWTFT
jgi:serine/threonine-protein kinase PknG